jgi:hypothetical protein
MSADIVISGNGVGVGVFSFVGVGVIVGVLVLVGVAVGVGVMVAVGVIVGVGVDVTVGDGTGVLVGVGVGVGVGLAPHPVSNGVPKASANPTSANTAKRSVGLAIVLPSSLVVFLVSTSTSLFSACEPSSIL